MFERERTRQGSAPSRNFRYFPDRAVPCFPRFFRTACCSLKPRRTAGDERADGNLIRRPHEIFAHGVRCHPLCRAHTYTTSTSARRRRRDDRALCGPRASFPRHEGTCPLPQHPPPTNMVRSTSISRAGHRIRRTSSACKTSRAASATSRIA